MPIGINPMAWGAGLGPAVVARFAWLREFGYDEVELPILAPGSIDTGFVRAALAAAGLGCTASTALPTGASLQEEDQWEVGPAFLRDCLAVGGAIGATVLSGRLFAPVGLHRQAPTHAERDRFVAAMRELALDAKRYGVRLAIEPVNRFEIGFLDTTEDGLRLGDLIGHPTVGRLAETFHMNIAERDVPVAPHRALPGAAGPRPRSLLGQRPRHGWHRSSAVAPDRRDPR